MLQNSKAFSGFSVDDAAAAKQFYGTVLGLDVRPVPGMETMGMLELHISGSTPLLIYQKAGHTPASFTILNFPVAHIDEAVDQLTARGIVFERLHDSAIPQDEKGIMRGKSRRMGPDIAWFKDPAGNTLAVMEQ